MSSRAFDTLVWLPLAVLHGVGMVDQMKVLPLTLSGNELFSQMAAGICILWSSWDSLSVCLLALIFYLIDKAVHTAVE